MSEEMIGHYRIVAELGRGGMGVVYKAHEESLNRFVAIKVLGEHLSQDPDYVTRFVREAQSAAKLSHPNIVQIYFIGEDAGKQYFVMEYVSGRSLQQLLRSDGRMVPPRATRLILQAASGLAAAHDQGVIHRDIKPANLILSDGNLLKIADFGLALMPDAASRLTMSGMFMGTPGYLSPEQCLDSDLDCRTDIYSLGVTYFEMLTGTAPFRADSPLALIRKIAEEEPPPVSELNPDVDERVRAILARMMAKDREQRYPDAHELVDAVEDYLDSTGGRREPATGGAVVMAPPAPPPPADAQALNTSPTMAVESGVGSSPGSTAPVGAAGGTTAVPPPPPLPPSPDSPEAGGAPWPDEAPIEAPLVADAPMVGAPPPQAGSGRSRMLMVVLILVVVGVGLLGLAGVVAWRTGLLGRGVQMARAAFGASRVASAEGTAQSMPSDQVEVAGGSWAESSDSSAAEPVAAAPAGSSAQGVEPVPGGGSGDMQGGSQTASAGAQAASAPPPAGLQVAASSTPGGGERAATDSGRRAGPAPRRVAPRAEAAPAPAPAPAHGTALVVTGEPLLAGEVRSFLEKRLGGGGVELMDDGGLGGPSRLSPGDAIGQLRGETAALVLAQVEYLGERQVRYMGRYGTVFQARVTVQAYDVAGATPLGPRYSEVIEYTHLNVADKVEKALVGEASDLLSVLR